MNRWIRLSLGATTVLAMLAGTAVIAGLQLADERMNRRIDIAAHELTLPSDASHLARGRYLYTTRGCADCHGADGAGRVFVDDGSVRLKGPNITAGTGSVTTTYRVADWERTLRHGVKPDGRPLRVMPSQDYARLTDEDLGALVAHVRALPPVPGSGAEVRLPMVARVLYGFGQIPDAASLIDHSLPPAQPVAEGVTLEHGRYVASMCIGCHGPQLAGGRIPGAPPDWPAAADLRPVDGGVMRTRYTDARQLTAMLRSGRRPDGTAIAVMPFDSLKHLSDVDAAALQHYLASLQAPGATAASPAAAPRNAQADAPRTPTRGG